MSPKYVHINLYDIWESFGRPLGAIWTTSGCDLDDIWESFGRHLGIIWKAYAIDVDDIWGSFVVIHFLQDEKKEGWRCCRLLQPPMHMLCRLLQPSNKPYMQENAMSHSCFSRCRGSVGWYLEINLTNCFKVVSFVHFEVWVRSHLEVKVRWTPAVTASECTAVDPDTPPSMTMPPVYEPYYDFFESAKIT